MSAPILATKLYIPPPRPKIVLRPRLIERLNEGLSGGCKLTLISASAGFGKTTLVSEWVAGCKRREPQVRVAWLSLEQGDNDPTRFLTYLVVALQTIWENLGAGVLRVLQSPQPPPTESILTALLNEIAAIPDNFILVLDDYHLMDTKSIDASTSVDTSTSVDAALTFMIEHQPPQMHLVIATREDPHLPLARLRVRDQLTELRAADLRFTPSEAADFLNLVMGLNLSGADIAALETRTEGWIAGLQLAALSIQGHQDTAGFIKSFTGSHHFVLDYLLEEVLHRQPASVQAFLLRTSILDRMCGSLCDAVLHPDADRHSAPSASGQETLDTPGQETLERLERANLFIVPLDNERHWYRYHHLFAELLQQRLLQQLHPSVPSAPGAEETGVADLHIRASEWYENSDLMLEAFRHAAAANAVERAARLMEDKRMPLHLPGVAMAILNWLESLPRTVLDSQPALWWKQAAMLMEMGQTIGVEEKLKATEAAIAAAALPDAELDDKTRNLIGKIAVARALLAQTLYQVETSLVQARRALDYLHPNNLPYRSTATQVIGFAYYLQGDRAEAGRAYAEALSLAQAAGDIADAVMAITRLAQIQELGNQLYRAAETYQRALHMIGDYPPSNAAVVYLGLARILYEWNDLDAAEQYGEKSLHLAQQYDQVIDRLILSELFLAGLKLARGDAIGAARLLAQTEQTTRQKNFTIRLPDIAAAQVLVLLHQGNVDAAAQLAQQYDLPLIQARVLIAQDDPSAALAVLGPYRQQAEAKNWQDQRLRVIALQAVAHQAHGEKDKAVQLLGEALSMAEPGGFIRFFVDKGEPMRLMLSDSRFRIDPRLANYTAKLLSAFPAAPLANPKSEIPNPSSEIPIEPLSERELQVLQLIAQGLSNREISARLFLALDTVKGHNRRIFDKLQVQRRTEAIARARELGLL